ncbi:MAG: hypothetical protein K0R57_6537 [Paenibacillaceae bacterium]|nr:hypothetical protein [Paenibacillaceae bacterium]
MKKSFVRILLIALACSLLLPPGGWSRLHAAALETGNLVENPGFEEEGLGPWIVKPGAPALLERDTAIKHSGAASGKVTPRTGEYSYLRQEVVLKKGVTYVFSAWVRLNPAAQGKKYIYIKLDYPNSTDPSYTSGGSAYPKVAITGTLGSGWARIQGTHTYTGSLDEVRVGMLFETDYHATNTFHVDDVSVAELLVPASIAVAGPSAADVPHPGTETELSYQASVLNQHGTGEGMEGQSVQWSIDPAPAEGLAISQSGALTVGPAVLPGVYRVTASLASSGGPPPLTGYWPVVIGELPPAAEQVAVSGRLVAGETVTGGYVFNDPNGDEEAGSSYQWWRGLGAEGPFTAIGHASGTAAQHTPIMYALTEADGNRYLRLQVIPRSNKAPSVGEAVYSSPVYVSLTNAPPAAAQASVSGLTVPGQTLTGSYEYADINNDAEGGSLYQWYIGDTAGGSYSPLAGENSRLLTVAALYSERYVQFEVTPVDSYGLAGTPVRSAPLQIRYDTRTELYVDPALGDDGNAGTELSPFRTIERARDEIRTMNGVMHSDLTVYLRGGIYDYSTRFTARTVPASYQNYTVKTSLLTFDQSDSGSNGYKIIYRAYPGEKPVISGGAAIEGWMLHDSQHSIYKAYVGPELSTRQLYVNGQRAVRARSEGPPANATFEPAYGHTSTDITLAELSRPQDLEFVYQTHWMQRRIRVDSISAADGLVAIRMNTYHWQYAAGTAAPAIYADYHLKYMENAYELLDSEGEWYLNRGDGYLYYKPRAGEDMQTAQVTVPVVDELLTVKGASPEQPVHDLQFTGLSFQYAGWLRPEFTLGYHSNQNNTIRDAGSRLPESAVTVQSARSMSFERNEFTHLGSTGLFMRNGIKDSLIRGNLFHDISGSAVNVEDPTVSTPQKAVQNPNLLLSGVEIVNNSIHEIGVEYEPASAISVAHGRDLTISHNEIRDIPYTAVHLGWHHSVDEPVVTKNVYVANNYIDDVMSTGLYDGGSIYSLGRTAGSVSEPAYFITGNYMRDQLNNGGVFFPDDYSNWWLAQGNVIDVSRSPVWQDHGTQNKPLTPLFVHMSRAVMSDNRFVGNYTTTGTVNDKGTNNSFEQMHIVPDAIWNPEAVDIIAEAGLEREYRDLLEPEHYNVVRNSGFESRQGNVWEPIRAAFTKTVADRYAGVYSARVDRAAEDGHIRQQIVMNKGMNYQFSLQVRLASGSGLSGTVKLDFGPSVEPTQVVTVAAGTADSSGWTALAGAYTYDGAEIQAKPYVYFEPSSGTGTTAYYLDQFQVIEVPEAEAAALDAAVERAVTLHLHAVEGEAVGQYASGSRSALQTAINEGIAAGSEPYAAAGDHYRALARLSAKTVWFIHQQHRQADFSALQSAIDAAQQLYDATQEGTSPGQYADEDRQALEAAIQAALAVSNDENAAQQAVDSAQAALDLAVRTYRYLQNPVDEAFIRQTIDDALQLLAGATEGNGPGEYALGSKQELLEAADAAQDFLQGLNPGAAAARNMLRDLEQWTSPLTPQDGYVEVFGRGIGYGGQTFGEELLELEMEYSYSEGDWPSFNLRSSSPSAGTGTGASSYMIIMKQDVWELQKWVNGSREMLIGELAGHTPRWGVLPNTQIASGSRHKLQMGAIAAPGGGIRLVLYVDEQLVFDRVDDINPLTDCDEISTANLPPKLPRTWRFCHQKRVLISSQLLSILLYPVS